MKPRQSQGIGDVMALWGGAGVVPKQGGPDDFAIGVEEHGAVHLTAKPDGGELDSVSTLVCELQGFANCKNRVAPPHVRVLLGPIRGAERRWIARPRLPRAQRHQRQEAWL